MSAVLIPVGDGGDDVIAVDVVDLDVEDGVELNAWRPGQSPMPRSLLESVDRVLPSLVAVVNRVREQVAQADELEVEVGLSVGGETGLILARGTAEATFALRMVWRRPIVTPGEDTGER